MGNEFFTWGNFITWVICSFLIYASLNFRLYMIFHHPGRKMKEKVRERVRQRRSAQVGTQGAQPAPQVPAWKGECLEDACLMQRSRILSDKASGEDRHV